MAEKLRREVSRLASEAERLEKEVARQKSLRCSTPCVHDVPHYSLACMQHLCHRWCPSRLSLVLYRCCMAGIGSYLVACGFKGFKGRKEGRRLYSFNPD